MPKVQPQPLQSLLYEISVLTEDSQTGTGSIFPQEETPLNLLDADLTAREDEEKTAQRQYSLDTQQVESYSIRSCANDIPNSNISKDGADEFKEERSMNIGEKAQGKYLSNTSKVLTQRNEEHEAEEEHSMDTSLNFHHDRVDSNSLNADLNVPEKGEKIIQRASNISKIQSHSNSFFAGEIPNLTVSQDEDEDEDFEKEHSMDVEEEFQEERSIETDNIVKIHNEPVEFSEASELHGSSRDVSTYSDISVTCTTGPKIQNPPNDKPVEVSFTIIFYGKLCNNISVICIRSSTTIIAFQ